MRRQLNMRKLFNMRKQVRMRKQVSKQLSIRKHTDPPVLVLDSGSIGSMKQGQLSDSWLLGAAARCLSIYIAGFLALLQGVFAARCLCLSVAAARWLFVINPWLLVVVARILSLI